MDLTESEYKPLLPNELPLCMFGKGLSLSNLLQAAFKLDHTGTDNAWFHLWELENAISQAVIEAPNIASGTPLYSPNIALHVRDSTFTFKV